MSLKSVVFLAFFHKTPSNLSLFDFDDLIFSADHSGRVENAVLTLTIWCVSNYQTFAIKYELLTVIFNPL